MPKKMFWIEVLFARVPINRKNLGEQILMRFSFLLLLWIIGFVTYSLDGLGAAYVSNTQLHLAFFGSGLIILVGSYQVQTSLETAILSIRPSLNLNDSQFRKLCEKLERYSYSIVPVLLIALIFTTSLPGNRIDLTILESAFKSLHMAWTVALAIFLNLVNATGIWLGVSIWLTIFLTSRQPLHIELSSKTPRKFRELTNLALAFALFYFLAIALTVIIPLSSSPITSLLDLIISPFLIYIVIGLLGVLLPIYNIHRTIVTLKRQELLRIEEEFEQMEKQLNDVQKETAQKLNSESLVLMDRLFSLQIRERRVKSAKDWPIDLGFVSKLLGMILAPAMAKILPEILNRLNL